MTCNPSTGGGSCNKIHLWIPGAFQSAGGIERYNAFLLKAFMIWPEIEVTAFLKNDTSIPVKVTRSQNSRFFFFGRYIKMLRTLIYACRIFLKALSENPALIVCCHMHFAPIAWLLRHIQKSRYWVILYGIEAWNISSPWHKKALSLADQIIAISHVTRDRFVQNKISGIHRPVQLLPPTFDDTRFDIRKKSRELLAKHHLDDLAPVLLTVARLSKSEQYKGYDQVIRILPELIREFSAIHYLIVGDGNDRMRIQKLVERLGLVKNVTLTGFVSEEILPLYYNLCDVFVMPSRSEGFGIVYLEALASGKPVIAGNGDASKEALLNSDLGVLVSPENFEELKKAIVQILKKEHSNPQLYQPEVLRQKAIDHFGFLHFQESLRDYLHLSGFFATTNILKNSNVP